MRAMIVYDSMFGNTKIIAETIAKGIDQCEAGISHVSQADPLALQELSLLIVGSPTRGFRPTPDIIKFIDSIPANHIAGIAVAAFDTRIASVDVKKKFFRFLVEKGGYAAPVIADRLSKKGGTLILPPEGFFVEGEKGPLKEGEEKRATNWAVLACHA